MPKTLIRFVQSILIPILLGFAQPVLAHGDEPRLEISVDRVNPGSVVDVRGVDFEPEESILLALVSEGLELQVAEAIANEEGVFLQIVSLPVDLLEGEYHFRATTDDHQILSPVLLVQGSALLEETSEPVREDDDALLAPMPTFAPDVVPDEASQAATRLVPEQEPVAGRNWTMMLLFAVAVAAVIAAFWLRATGKVHHN